MLNFVISCSGRQGRCALGCLRLMRIFALLGCVVGVNGASSPAPSPAPPVEIVIHAIQSVSFHSAALGQAMNYQVLLPAGYAESETQRYPVLYLLHGRGDKMQAWAPLVLDLLRLTAEGRIPPVITIMPDAPSSQRAGYYIDSKFTGNARLPPGQALESAIAIDLLAQVDRSYRTQASRTGRIIAGYSMGGYGAMRLALAHPELFGGAIVLSPAVYLPLPPPDSSTREFGAFGNEAKIFDPEIYTAKNYPALIPGFVAAGRPLIMFIAVGDDEKALADPAEAAHDLDYEAHTLYNRIRRVPDLTSELRVVNGPHNWATWRPTFIEGVQYVFAKLPPAAAAKR